jgi:hypothetical protein
MQQTGIASVVQCIYGRIIVEQTNGKCLTEMQPNNFEQTFLTNKAPQHTPSQINFSISVYLGYRIFSILNFLKTPLPSHCTVFTKYMFLL